MRFHKEKKPWSEQHHDHFIVDDKTLRECSDLPESIFSKVFQKVKDSIW